MKPKSEPDDFFGSLSITGMVDIHTHIIPELDDGAENMEQALEMARISSEEGVAKMVATPHIFRESYGYDDLAFLPGRIEKLNKVLQSRAIDMEILPGAEVHVSHDLLIRVRKNRQHLMLNEGSYMFVEFPSEHIFPGVPQLLFEIMKEGITAIVAHPERNSVFRRRPGILFDLIQKGALCQANGGSFLGTYGSKVQEAALFFLEHRMVHFVASDCHNTRTLKPCLFDAVQCLRNLVEEDVVEALVRDNPSAVVEDKALPYLPDPHDPEKKRNSFRIKLPGFFRTGKK